jgi:hypothetical protein
MDWAKKAFLALRDKGIIREPSLPMPPEISFTDAGADIIRSHAPVVLTMEEAEDLRTCAVPYSTRQFESYYSMSNKLRAARNALSTNQTEDNQCKN